MIQGLGGMGGLSAGVGGSGIKEYTSGVPTATLSDDVSRMHLGAASHQSVENSRAENPQDHHFKRGEPAAIQAIVQSPLTPALLPHSHA